MILWRSVDKKSNISTLYHNNSIRFSPFLLDKNTCTILGLLLYTGSFVMVNIDFIHCSLPKLIETMVCNHGNLIERNRV